MTYPEFERCYAGCSREQLLLILYGVESERIELVKGIEDLLGKIKEATDEHQRTE